MNDARAAKRMDYSDREGLTRKHGRSCAGKIRSRVLIFCAFFALLMCLFARAAAAAENPQAAQLAAKNVLENARVAKTSKGYICRQNCKRRTLKNKWVTINGSVYYFNWKGYAQTGEFTYKGCSYYAAPDGKVYISRWRYVGGTKTYYYGKTAIQLRSCWYRIGSKRYYFKQDGTVARNTWIGAYFVRRDGTRVEGLKRTKNTEAADSGGKQPSKPGETAPEWKTSDEQKLIIMGASRVVQMAAAVPAQKNIIYIAKSGAGYSWFTRCGLPELRAYLSVYPCSKVVFQYGNNDTTKSKDMYFPEYRAVYEQLIAEYPQTSFYFMDALPSDLSQCKAKNAKCRVFNEKLKEAFPMNAKGGYIGGYSWMIYKGFAMIDRYHYDSATYNRIFRFILKKVSWQG